MTDLRLTLKQKAVLMESSFLIGVVMGSIMSYLENPFWRVFCIGVLIGWLGFGFIISILFLVEFVQLKTDPELSAKIEKYEKKYGKLVENE